MIFWSAKCAECGVTEPSNKHMTEKEAKKWAHEWEKKHRKEAHDGSAYEAPSEEGSQP